MGLKVDGNPNAMSIISRVLNSWASASTRGEKRQEVEAEQRARDLPCKLSKSKHLPLVRAYNTAVRELAESEIPAPVTIDVKLAQCEDGEHIAEKLSAVALKEEVPEEDVVTPRLTTDGALVFSRGQKVDVGMPKSTEYLRKRIRTLATSWAMVKLQLPEHALLVGLTESCWLAHVEWLLG